MDIRNILVSLDPLAGPSPTLGLAVSLAEKLGATLSVAAAARPWVDVASGLVSTAAIARYDEQRVQIETGLAELESAYTGSVVPRMRGRFHALVEEPTQHLIDRAMAADLVVVGGGSIGAGESATRVDAGRLILAAGRPVLLAMDGATDFHLETVLVAWKDTREARRAVADALPLLKRAKHVFVACVDEEDYALERQDLADVLAWLGTHGIKAKGDVLPFQGSVVDTLEVSAASLGADIVVAGGYGHTRLQEWLFGGATYDLLRVSKRHRFLSN